LHGLSREALRGLVDRRFRSSVDSPARFFPLHAPAIARACHAMSSRFEQGGRLLVFGEGAEATDAAHVSVEFVHPVLVGKRALPAIALATDAAALTGLQRHGTVDAFARSLRLLGRAQDIALGISRAAPSDAVREGLIAARDIGMLTLLLTGEASIGSVADGFDFEFTVPSTDPLVVQEVQETLYHIMWELVHVFFEAGVLDP
jgi:D-sedoheptulose 7-phosphate isomerase